VILENYKDKIRPLPLLNKFLPVHIYHRNCTSLAALSALIKAKRNLCIRSL